ncbi:transporter [Bordetella genomosp. 10]|uniref:Transporter n=1 Tax=Bordetella genomosp. 10 TaxID=1416804 RepID=A0A261SLU4_9BORD|nr:ABC transporter substrate-binding protein [Bordetella genomosp. 10]OZI37922.1 transporter [Bordetella genomosp. 10]
MTAGTSKAARAALLAVSFAWAAGAAQAQDRILRIGLASEPTSMDPHYHQATPNDALSAHVFETLVASDAKMNLAPGLATAWKPVDDTTWEFTLRQGVRFSNGQPFTPEDVMFTFCRVLNNPQAIASSYENVAKKIEAMSVKDGSTLVVKTKAPYPLLANELTRIWILWSGIVQHDRIRFDPAHNCGVTGPWPKMEDFNSGKNAIGTGPYTFKSFVRGTAVTLSRNEGYWGTKPAWTEVRMTPVPGAGPRLTGLLAGDFDLIENPAARDLKRLDGDGKHKYVVTPSARVLFLQMDVARSPSPQVHAPDGKNPLQDVRVRKAISMAIDRKTIAQRIMDGAATPANQFLPDGMFGALPHAPELKYDPAGAKKLLAEAGYPNGFSMTLSATNDRYINDAAVAQAVAQYLTRVGIKTDVNAMTRALFFPQRAKREFSFAMGGWGSDTGEASSFLTYWVTSLDKQAGAGTSNYGGFSDPEFDKVFRQAITTVDPGQREKLLQQAVRRALDLLPSIPLHFESSAWAFRSDIAYEGRADQLTLAASARPVH